MWVQGRWLARCQAFMYPDKYKARITEVRKEQLMVKGK